MYISSIRANLHSISFLLFAHTLDMPNKWNFLKTDSLLIEVYKMTYDIFMFVKN